MLQTAIIATSSLISYSTLPSSSYAFDGGVGGLGKTRPETGVIFRNTDVSESSSSPASIATFNMGGGGSNSMNSVMDPIELYAPNKQNLALVSFRTPWPLLRSSSSIESRDLQNPESAFVQVVEVSSGVDESELTKNFFMESVFGTKGKFGMYGSPTDVKSKRIISKSSTSALYDVSFTTLTPAMRESERRAYISASKVGNGMFLLVVTSTASRFRRNEGLLKDVAESWTVFEAPKSG